MCLTVLNSGGKTPPECVQIATRDIVVYKCVTRRYRRMDVQPGRYYAKVYTSFAYQLGYHYYQTGHSLKKMFSFKKESFWPHRIEVNRGLHSFKRKPDIFGDGVVTLRCIIPKGAKYFVGHEDYCSSQLIIVQEVRNKASA